MLMLASISISRFLVIFGNLLGLLDFLALFFEASCNQLMTSMDVVAFSDSDGFSKSTLGTTT